MIPRIFGNAGQIVLGTLLLAVAVGCAGDGQVTVEWADFIRFKGISYHAYREEPVGRALEEGDLGPAFAKVEHVAPADDPDYRPRNGDAAFLRAGTLVYTVEGYEPQFRLAVLEGDEVKLYEVADNPDAKTGSDVLDIGGRVRYITVSNTIIPGIREEELSRIEDPRQVVNLVDTVLKAPVVYGGLDEEGKEYWITFHLEDGTSVERSYWPGSNRMSWKFESSWSIVLLRTFRTVIGEAKDRAAT